MFRLRGGRPSPLDPVSLLVLLACVAGLGTAGVLLGADGNYDLRNYHFYSGWAALHKTVGFDLAPAQVQTYQHPLLDIMFFLVSRALNDVPRVFTFVWSVPQAVAVWLSFLVGREVFGGSAGPRLRDALAAAAALVAADGGASLGVVGTSMSEGIPNACLLAAVLISVRVVNRERDGVTAGHPLLLLVAGAAVGLAVGFKLTMATYAVAFGAAWLLVPGIALRRRGTLLLCYGAASFAVLMAVGLPWWLAVWRAFGNPLFPYYNAVFRSPLYGDWNFADDRFFPKTAWEWLAYPLRWAFHPDQRVAEEPVRDPRLLLVVLGSVVLLVRAVANRAARHTPTLWCALFALGSYALWLRMFSILRYASGLETLSGVVIVAALLALLPARANALRVGAVLLAAVALLAVTIPPTWERRKQPGNSLVSVVAPSLPPDTLVLMLVATPASYVAAWEPVSVRFVGLQNSLLQLQSTFGLQALVERTIADAPGPIWGLDKTDAFFGEAEASLARYHLRRTAECHDVLSNIDTHLRLCRLERVG